MAGMAFKAKAIVFALCLFSLAAANACAAPLLNIQIITPASGSVTKTNKTNVFGTFNIPGVIVLVNGVRASVSGSRFTAYNIPLRPGTNTLQVIAYHPASRQQKTAAAFITSDTVPPRIAFTNVSDGAWTNNPSYYMRGSIGEAGSVTLNGAPFAVSGKGFQFSASARLKENENVLTLIAKDRAGNTAQKSVRVYLDSRPPYLQLTGPANESKTNKPDTVVTGTVNERATVTFSGKHQIPLHGKPFSFPMRLAEGWNTLSVAARDRGGNISRQTVRVLLDTTPPRRPPRIDGISIPAQTRVMAGNPLDIRVQASDPQAGALSYRMSLDGVVAQGWGNASSMRWTPTDAQFGPKRIKVEAKNPYDLSAARETEVFVLRRPKQPPPS